MWYKVHTSDGLMHVEKTENAAIEAGNKTGKKFVIFRHFSKASHPHIASVLEGGFVTRQSMLLYPKGSVCKMYTPAEYLKEVFA